MSRQVFDLGARSRGGLLVLWMAASLAGAGCGGSGDGEPGAAGDGGAAGTAGAAGDGGSGGTGGTAGSGGTDDAGDASGGNEDADSAPDASHDAPIDGDSSIDGPIEDSATDVSSDVLGDVVTDGPGGDTAEVGPGGCVVAADCDDGIACTVDACSNATCKHWAGPGAGATACPAGQVCDPTSGCVGAPVCSAVAQCQAVWATDPCKVNVTCNTATASCSFSVLDSDNDGHPPLACGGDDCNDAAKNVYPGQAEGCNEIDDDCNGAVDDGTLVGDCCPSTPMFANFDTACGGPTLDSEEWACGGTAATALDFPTTSLPVVIRTPSHPGLSPACAAACADAEDWAWAFSVGVTEAGIPNSAGDIKVTVAPPWSIRINSWPPQYCLLPLTHADCAIGLSMSYITFTILTTDPDAPAANVLLERVPEPGSCP